MLRQIVIGLCVFLLVIAFVPGIPPNVDFFEMEIDPMQTLTGPLELNEILDSAERMFEGHLPGPEAIASNKKDELFVGINNGDIIQIFGKDFENLRVISSSGSCDKPWDGFKCGRPLGLRFAANGKLLIADCYLGIIELDIKTGKRKTLINASEPIDGFTPKLVEYMDVDSAGIMYWSHASSHFNLMDASLDLLSSPSGRVLKYDPKTKTNEVLLKDIHFANGLQLSPKQDFLLVNECFRRRVIRYWLKGPKKGTHDIFVSGLPGTPDNIRERPEGGYYVSLVATSKSSLQSYDFFSKLPLLRKIAARSLNLLHLSIKKINSVFNLDYLSWLEWAVLDLSVVAKMSHDNTAIVVVLGENGEILESYQGTTGKINFISETASVGNYLFFGSPYNNYLGRLPKKYTQMARKASKDSKSSTKNEL